MKKLKMEIYFLLISIFFISPIKAYADKVYIPSDGAFNQSYILEDNTGRVKKMCPNGVSSIAYAMMSFASWNDPWKSIGTCYSVTFFGALNVQWIDENIVLFTEKMPTTQVIPVLVYMDKGKHIDLHGKYIVKIVKPLPYDSVSGERINPLTAMVVVKEIGYEGRGPF